MTTLEVLMPTYRHAPFLAQAIDSVLAQRTTDVNIILLISDDGSDDGTQDIIRDYQQRHPDRIRARFVDPATKRTDSTDSLPGRETLIAHYRWASAEYIGLLEGDDYWIDADKVQLQVDHLRARPTHSFCFTNAYNEYDGHRREDYVRGWLKGAVPAGALTQKDIVAANFVPTAGVIYRRSCFLEIPEPFHSVAALDWILYIALAEKGEFSYIDRHSAVRRVHEGGVISMKPPLVKIDRNLHLLSAIDRMTQGRHARSLDERRVHLLRTAIQHAVDSGTPLEGKPYLAHLTADPRLRQQVPTKEILRSTILLRAPWLGRLIHRVLG
jgi:Glycosyl transferase family 2